MLREQVCAVLNRQRKNYDELANATTDLKIRRAAQNAARSVDLTLDRIENPRDTIQKRRPSDYALKRLVDIQVRFVNHLSNSDELRRARQIEAMRSVTIDLRSLIESERSA